MKVSNNVSVWCMAMALILAATSAQLTWTVNSDRAKYSELLSALRKELGTGKETCGRLVTEKKNDNKYVLVDLVLTFDDVNTNTITLALRASNAYLVGFQDMETKTKKLRASFFSDESKLRPNYKSIFPKAEVLGPALPTKGSYPDLVRTAKVTRNELSVGVFSLQNAMAQVYGKAFTGQNAAKFALIAIRMVAEAARFKYIENQVRDRGMSNSFNAVGTRITDLENDWSKISEQYYKTCDPKIDYKEGVPYTEKELDLGLLQYKTSGLNANDDGHATLAFI